MATRAKTNSLYIRNQDNTYRKATNNEIIHTATRIINRRFRKGRTLSSPREVQDLIKLRLAKLEYELFSVLWLDNRHRVIKFEELFRGTIDGASVYPREIVKSALSHNAAACILAHNHPSGEAKPSQADITLTEQLTETLGLIEIRVLDHIIVAENCVSLAEMGLM